MVAVDALRRPLHECGTLELVRSPLAALGASAAERVRTGYPAGKLPPDALRDLLRRYTRAVDGLVVGPAIGVDAAVVECGGPLGPRLVVTADPVTFAAESIGRYAVHVNANDVVCMGARPRWFLAMLLLPEGQTNLELVDSIFRDVTEACAEVGASLCGGHTEVTPGLGQPIVAGAMLGELVGTLPITPRGVRVGDVLILTKGIAVEGSAIIARDLEDRVRGRVPAAVLQRARGFLRDPGISVVRDALLALEAAGADGVHGLHDPTEGGLAQGIREMAEAASVGFRVQRRAIRILPETEALCRALDMDPLGLIASGALLIAAAPDRAPAIVSALRRGGTEAAIIGSAVEAREGLVMEGPDGLVPLPLFARDELARVLEG